MDSRLRSGGSIPGWRRRRACDKCFKRWTTIEVDLQQVQRLEAFSTGLRILSDVGSASPS